MYLQFDVLTSQDIFRVIYDSSISLTASLPNYMEADGFG